MGTELFEIVKSTMPLPVENDSCVNNRSVGETKPPETDDFEELMDWYAGELLSQVPCMRMMDNTGRKKLYTRLAQNVCGSTKITYQGVELDLGHWERPPTRSRRTRQAV